MASPFSVAEIDALLADHEMLADVDFAIATIRSLGLEPRPDVIRQQAALNDIEPGRAELFVALIGRRLSSLEGSL